MATGPGGVEEGRASIRVVPDLSNFASELKSELEGIVRTLKIEIPVAADTSGVAEHVRLAAEQAQALAPDITLNTNVDTDQIQKNLLPQLAQVRESANSTSGIFSGWVPLIAAGVLALATIAPVLATLAPILALLGPLIGAVVLSLGGLQDVFAPLVAGFNSLRGPITAIVTEGLKPLVKTFSGEVMPLLKTGLTAAAVLINAVLKGFLSLGRSKGFVEGMQALISGAADVLTPLATIIPQLATAFVQLGLVALPALRSLIGAFAIFVTNLTSNLNQANVLQSLLMIISQATQAFVTLSGVAGATLGALLRIGVALAPVFIALGNALIPVITMLGTTLAAEIQSLAPELAGLALILGPALAQAIKTLTPSLLQLTVQFAATLAAVLPLLPPILKLANVVLPLLANGLNVSIITILKVIQVVAEAITWFGSFAAKLGGAVTGAIAAAKTALSGLITFFSGLPNAILTAIGNVAGDFVQVGHDIIAGIVHGISDAAGSVGDAVKGAISGALKKANVFAKINSPSLLFSKELGEPISEGIAHGVTKAAGQIPDAIIKAIAPPDLSGSQDGLAALGAGQGGVNFYGNVGWDPDEVANKIWTKQRDQASVFGLQAIGAVG